MSITISWVDKDPMGTPTIYQRKLPDTMTMEEAREIQDFIQELVTTKNDLLRYADALRQRQQDTKEKLLQALDILSNRDFYTNTEASVERCKSCNQLTYQCICSYPHKHKKETNQ